MNHMIGFVGAKGGVGTTVTAVRAARQALASGTPVTLVDVTGDMAMVLRNNADADGISDLLGSEALFSDAQDAVASHLVDVGDGVRLLPRGLGAIDPADRRSWAHVWDALAHDDSHVVIDAGRGDTAFNVLDTAGDRQGGLRRVLVMGCGFQDLAHARILEFVFDPDDLVIISDPQRTLGVDDMHNGLGRDDSVVLVMDRRVSTAADSGQLLALTSRDGHELGALMDLDPAAAERSTPPLAWMGR